MTELTEKNSLDAMIDMAALPPERVAAVCSTSTDPENIAALDADAPLGNVEFPAVAHALDGTCATSAEAKPALAQQETDAPAYVHQDYPPHPARNLAADGVEEYLPEMIPMYIVRTDGGTQTRMKINDAVVADYADALREGAKLPPVLLYYEQDINTFWLADGFHRFGAHVTLGSVDIVAIVRIGTRRDAVLHAVGANSAHDLRRSNEDKRKAVTTLLADAEWAKWSDNQLAKACGVSNHLVADVKSSVTLYSPSEAAPTERTYITKHGTTSSMNTANIGKVKAAEEHHAGEIEGSATAPAVESIPVTTDTKKDTPVEATGVDELAALREEYAILRAELDELKVEFADTLASNDMMGRVFDADDQVKAAMAEATRHKALMENAERMLSARSHEFNERARLVTYWKNRAEKAEKQLSKGA